MSEQTPNNDSKTFTEEIEIAGNQLVEQVKSLVEEGNVRQLRITSADKKLELEMPLTIGILAGGAVALAAPWIAVLGAFAALVVRAKIEVVREIKTDEVVEEPEAQ
jgi:hypothetical protein